MEETLKQLKSKLLDYQLTYENYTDDIGIYPENLALINKDLSLFRQEEKNISETEQITIAQNILKKYQEFYNKLDDKTGFTFDNNELSYKPKKREITLFDKYCQRINNLFTLYNLELFHNVDDELSQIYDKIVNLMKNKNTLSEDIKIKTAKEILTEFDTQIKKLDDLQVHLNGKGEY
jgi:hypothetical protein